MDNELVMLLVFIASLVVGLGLYVSILIQQNKKFKLEQKDTGYYSYRFFYGIGYLVGAPISILLSNLLIPKWVFDEPYNPFLTAIPIVVTMYLSGKLFALIFRKKIRPLTSKEKTTELIGSILLLVLTVYVAVIFALHYQLV